MPEKIPMGCLVDIAMHNDYVKMAADNERPVASEMRIAMKSHLEKYKQKKRVAETIRGLD